ncbi:hypothetical protein ABT336_13130 [Micromonospora sp. NPDC000207]|uniref:hypothetical protein n=1 Tax=Micromonospora sp. NPDC000207 TaxID=3154246 RepID=UPI00331EDC35
MTVSFEISGEHRDKWPPFADGCEVCLRSGFTGTVVPHATVTQGDTLMAFYHHARCGRRWFTSWGAAWDWTWQRIGPADTPALGGRGELRALPAPRRSA